MSSLPPEQPVDSHTTNGRSVSDTVIEKVAARENVDPTDLDHRLYEIIDPDALDAIFASLGTRTSRSDGHVQFSYCGYEVAITSDGDVTVT